VSAARTPGKRSRMARALNPGSPASLSFGLLGWKGAKIATKASGTGSAQEAFPAASRRRVLRGSCPQASILTSSVVSEGRRHALGVAGLPPEPAVRGLLPISRLRQSRCPTQPASAACRKGGLGQEGFPGTVSPRGCPVHRWRPGVVGPCDAFEPAVVRPRATSDRNSQNGTNGRRAPFGFAGTFRSGQRTGSSATTAAG
jgi:hypothetical protein